MRGLLKNRLMSKFILLMIFSIIVSTSITVITTLRMQGQFTHTLSKKALIDKGSNLAKLISRVSITPLEDYDYATVAEYTQIGCMDQDIAYIYIVDIHGRPLGSCNTNYEWIKSTVDNLGGNESKNVLEMLRKASVNVKEISLDILNEDEKQGKAIVGVSLVTTGLVKKEITRNFVRVLFRICLITLLILAILSIIIFKIFSVLVMKPIASLNEMMKHVREKGDLTKQIAIIRNDEIGDLTQGFNHLINGLNEIIKSVTTITDTLLNSSQELISVADQMNKSAEDMNLQSNAVASASEQASVNVNNISGSTNEMASSVGAVASSIEEMNFSLNEISKNCVMESQIAAKANSEAITTGETIRKLEVTAKEIGKILDTVDGIASQTNLLALNATIEAASAGEAGKGFAVVANEVKELSKQTSQATGETSKQIENMQNNIKNSVNAIKNIIDVIEQVNSISGSIASAVEEHSATTNEISGNINNVNNASGGVAKNVHEIAKGMGEVSSNIQKVNMVAKDTSRAAVMTNQSAQKLATMAEDLKKILGQFHV